MRHGVIGVNDIIVGDKKQNKLFFPSQREFLLKDLGGVREELAELQVINKAVSVSNEKLMKSNQEMLKLILLLVASKRFTKPF